MNFEEILTYEYSKKTTDTIVAYIGEDKKRYKQLMQFFLNADPRLCQCAAWSVSLAGIAQPQLVNGYFSALIDKLKQPGQHAAVYRNILRLFEAIKIPEKYHVLLIDQCFKIIADPSQAVAVVAFAISVATKLCLPFVELKNELRLLLLELTAHPLKPAIKVRVRRALKVL
jgi:hypothetical protein